MRAVFGCQLDILHRKAETGDAVRRGRCIGAAALFLEIGIIYFRLKSSVFCKVDILWTTGRSAQKIRFLIFKIAKTAELLATPTNKQKRKTEWIEDYQFKAAVFTGKCQHIFMAEIFVFDMRKTIIQVAAVEESYTVWLEWKWGIESNEASEFPRSV